MREIEYSLFNICLNALFFDNSDSDNILLTYSIMLSRYYSVMLFRDVRSEGIRLRNE